MVPIIRDILSAVFDAIAFVAGIAWGAIKLVFIVAFLIIASPFLLIFAIMEWWTTEDSMREPLLPRHNQDLWPKDTCGTLWGGFRWCEDEQTRTERVEAERIAQAWLAHEQHWKALERGHGPLTFEELPWPVLNTPIKTVADITHTAVREFVLSPVHSGCYDADMRARRELLRYDLSWGFGLIMARVDQRDRPKVEAGIECVCRALVGLVERD